jgi:4-amino-4-deoxy-L-arabinose transferase-like glycosyltransferase
VSALVVFALPVVGRRPLVNQDEARFALLAREGVEHGQWLLPRVRGVIYLNKPPLYFWTVGLLALPFGVVDDVTAPLASVGCALVTLLAVVALGRRQWDPDIGLTAGFVLATAPFFYFMSHQVLSDMMLTAWLAWALYFLLRARQAAAPGRLLAGYYLCLAGALATKGPAALMGLAAALAVVLAEDGWRGLRWLRLPMGLGILALCSLPWVLLYLLQSERSYVGGVVVGHYGEWYFREKPGSRLAAFGGNLGRFLPWTLFLIPGLWWWWRDRDARRRPLLGWTVVIALAVSLSGEQRARYFLPVLPSLSVLVAEVLVRLPREGGRPGRRVLMATYGALLLVALAAVAFLLRPAGRNAPGPDIFVPAPGGERWLVSLLMLGGLVAALVVLAKRGSGVGATLAVAIALGGILFVEGWGYPTRYAERLNIRGFTAAMATKLAPEERVLAYPDANLYFDFYLRRPVRELATPAELEGVLAAAPPGDVLLMRDTDWMAERPRAASRWEVRLTGQVGNHPMVLLGPRR